MAKAKAKPAASGKAFSKRLAEANKFWKSAKKSAAEQGTMGSEFEDGKYLARLMGGKLAESDGGRLQIVFPFKFEEGEYEGQVKNDYQGVETEQNLVYLAKRLTQLGYEMPDSLEDVQEILDDIAATKPLCTIRIKTKGDFQNIYLQKVHDPDDEPESEDDEEEDTDAEETEEESEEEAEEEEEEEPAPKKKGKKTAKPAPVEEEEEEEETEEEEEEEAEEEDQAELEVGMNVVVETQKDGEQPGTVIEVLEAEGKVRVKLESGKTVRVPVDKLSAAVPDEPKAKAGKKGKK